MASAGDSTRPVGMAAVVMGVPVDDVTLGEAVDRIGALVASGRATGRTHQVATVNVDFVVKASGDPDLRALLQRTSLSIPDGMPLVWAAGLLGTPIRERTTGADLLPALAEWSAVTGHRLVLFGGRDEVAEVAAAGLRERAPGADIVAVPGALVADDGTMDEALLIPLQQVRPDVLCVALGNPKQERWIARYGVAVGAPVAIGIGGTLDFLAGVTRRAPGWMRASGLEWLHRAASEPRRLSGRYARDFAVFVPGLLRQLRAGRRRRAAVFPEVLDGGAVVTVRLLGPLPLAGPDPLALPALGQGRSLVVDVAGLHGLDNVTAAGIVQLVRGASLVPHRITGANRVVRRDAGRLGIGPLLETGKSRDDGLRSR